MFNYYVISRTIKTGWGRREEGEMEEALRGGSETYKNFEPSLFKLSYRFWVQALLHRSGLEKFYLSYPFIFLYEGK